MSVLQTFDVKSKGAGAAHPLTGHGPTPALAIYLAALAVYQRRPTEKGKAALFRSYRQWIRSFLDDEGETNRAANNFLIALRTQPPESREMGAAA